MMRANFLSVTFLYLWNGTVYFKFPGNKAAEIKHVSLTFVKTLKYQPEQETGNGPELKPKFAQTANLKAGICRSLLRSKGFGWNSTALLRTASSDALFLLLFSLFPRILC